jgi:phage-related protein
MDTSEEKWKIKYYMSPSGTYPVADFIKELDEISKAKIINTFTLLEDFGIRLGLPHTKKLTGTDLWELRILGGNNLRVFYIAITGKSFLMLHGFNKKKQKTDRQEIKTAEIRLKDFYSRIK